MKPTWQTTDGAVQLYLGDCLDVLPYLPLNAEIVTDPPYGIGYQYSCGPRANWRGRRGRFEASMKFDKIHGDDQPFDPLPLLKFPRVLMFGANHFANSGDDSFADAEFAWCSLPGIKRNVFRFLWKGLCCVKVGESNGRRIHPTQKPQALMEWCVSLVGDGGPIVDPYFGSGTTIVAAVRTGRSAIGIEKEEKYFDMAVRRIEAELNRAPLFEEPPQIQRTFTEATCS